MQVAERTATAATKSKILVIESEQNRAGDIVDALERLGYDARLAVACEGHEQIHDWRAVFVGNVARDSDAERQLALLGPAAERVKVFVASDSPWVSRLGDETGPFASRVGIVQFPLDSRQLNEVVAGMNVGGLRLVGSSVAIAQVNAQVRKVASVDSTVLVLGESGTGKEVIAKSIHAASSRKNKPFVAINCGAILPDLLESELFGHEKGAFTGAINTRKGRFEVAEGGTLFLDEIGDMSLPMQVKLLRVLQEREFERVGSNKTVRCDVRIIAATHRDLEKAVEAGTFRQDLYYRLCVFPVQAPALRDHAEDIPELITEFNHRLIRRGHAPVRVSQAALKSLRDYAWPGNVRELANVVEWLSTMHGQRDIQVHDLPEKLRSQPMIEEVGGNTLVSLLSAPVKHIAEPTPAPLTEYVATLPEDGIDLDVYLGSIEQSLIRQALVATDGVMARAARKLGMKRTTLAERVRKYGMAVAMSA